MFIIVVNESQREQDRQGQEEEFPRRLDEVRRRKAELMRKKQEPTLALSQEKESTNVFCDR